LLPAPGLTHVFLLANITHSVFTLQISHAIGFCPPVIGDVFYITLVAKKTMPITLVQVAAATTTITITAPSSLLLLLLLPLSTLPLLPPLPPSPLLTLPLPFVRMQASSSNSGFHLWF
jgi:hypothetical protein